MKLQQLLSRVRKAVDDYHMIQDEDHHWNLRRKGQSYAS